MRVSSLLKKCFYHNSFHFGSGRLRQIASDIGVSARFCGAEMSQKGNYYGESDFFNRLLKSIIKTLRPFKIRTREMRLADAANCEDKCSGSQVELVLGGDTTN